MNEKNGILIGLTLAVMFLALTTAAVSADLHWMAPQRVFNLMKEGSGLWLVDVRNEATFAKEHIEGSVNIPAGLLATKHLSKGKIIILVDDNLGLRKGREATAILMKSGHDRVFLLEGGMPAWKDEKYPVAGKGVRPSFRSVLAEDIGWAQEKLIPLRVFDLRDTGEQAQGTIQQAVGVEGKTLEERLEKVKTMVSGGEKRGIVTRLEKPTPIVLIFPTITNAQLLLERSFREVSGDIRFLEGGYAAWAAKPNKNVSAVGVCPTCPRGAPGGRK